MCHGLVFTACYSRHCFVFLTLRQTMEAVIAGFEAAWEFFGRAFAVIVPDNLGLVLSDEVERRDRTSASVRARAARLDPHMPLDAWDDSAAVSFDRQLWAELTTLRFIEETNNVLFLGPVGVGKTFLATALGHIACRRRYSVVFGRGDRLFKRHKAARLDASHDARCAASPVSIC